MIEALEKVLEELRIKREKLEIEKYEATYGIEELEDEIDRTIEESFSIKIQLHFLKAPCTKGENIDLREMKVGRTRQFNIYLHDTDTVIGYIEYRGYHIRPTLGDIGYEIQEEYRGKNYGYEALSMLGDILNKEGIEDFYIATTANNIPSKKIIERYDGVLFNQEEDILEYICKTKELEKKKKLVI